MDTTQFFDYLCGHPATASLADSVLELIEWRRASTARRMTGALRPIPVVVESDRAVRVAS